MKSIKFKVNDWILNGITVEKLETIMMHSQFPLVKKYIKKNYQPLVTKIHMVSLVTKKLKALK